MKAIFGEEAAWFEGQIIKRECIFLWEKKKKRKKIEEHKPSGNSV